MPYALVLREGFFSFVGFWLGGSVSARGDSDVVLYDMMSIVLRVHDRERRDFISGSLKPELEGMRKQDQKGFFLGPSLTSHLLITIHLHYGLSSLSPRFHLRPPSSE